MKDLHHLTHSVLVLDFVENASLQDIPDTIYDRVIALTKRNMRHSQSAAVPIFYRSKLLPAMSRESPSFLLDFVQPLKEEGDNVNDRNVFFSIYNMTYRYDQDSKWMDALQEIAKKINPKPGSKGPSHSHDSAPTKCDEEPSLTKVSEINIFLSGLSAVILVQYYAHVLSPCASRYLSR